MSILARELWFAVRLLVRRPAFSLVNVLTLGLAIGACATIYTVVYGIMLRPLPYPHPDRLVQLWQLDAKGQRSNFSDPNFQDVREQSQGFRAVSQFSQGTASAMVGTLPVRVRTASVSRDFFDVFGVEPALGRRFHEDERRVGAARVAIVDASFWLQHYGAAADLSSARLTVRGEPHTVVGVMPADFDFPANVDVWLPREATPANPFRTGHNSQVVARLADEATIDAARREGSVLARRMKQQYGDGTWMEDLAVVPLRDQLVGDVRPTLNILLAAVGLLLTIACANLSNLTLVRVSSRARELAVRSALGAGRARLMLPLIAESLILSAAGGAVGLALSTGGVAAVGAIAPSTLPRLGEVQINWPVAAFVFAITLLSGLALSGAGAVATVHWNTMTPLKTREGTSSSSWLRSSLVTGQLAVSVVLLVTAGLLGRSFQNLLNQNPGFRTEGLLAIDLSAPGPTVTPTPERIIISDPSALVRQARQNEQLLQRLAALPGVLATGGISPFPMSGGGANGLFGIVRPGDNIQTMRDLQALARDPARVGTAEFRVVSEGYFRAMGIPLVRGRLFGDQDGADAPHAAVISESLARARWPDADPIGAYVNQAGMDGDFRPLTIVGIVGDIRERGLDAEPRPTFYADYRQRPLTTFNFTFVLHTALPPASIVGAARTAISEIAPDIPPRFRTIDEVIGATVAGRRFALTLVGLFAAAAMLLAVLGVYGVLSYAVTERRHEFGVRIALGASSKNVLGLVLRQATIVLAAGVLIGLVGAAISSRVLQSMLFGITRLDAVTYTAVVLSVSAAAMVASLLPALRAARAEPLAVLRSDG